MQTELSLPCWPSPWMPTKCWPSILLRWFVEATWQRLLFVPWISEATEWTTAAAAVKARDFLTWSSLPWSTRFKWSANGNWKVKKESHNRLSFFLPLIQIKFEIQVVIERNFGFGFGRSRGFSWPKVNWHYCNKLPYIFVDFGQNWTSFGLIKLNLNQTLSSAFVKAYVSVDLVD